MAQIPDFFFILMKDINGEKAPPKVPGVSLGSAKSVQVLRGELLTPIPPRERVQLSNGRALHNYRSWRDPNILLYSIEDNVTPMLSTSSELQLLQAIEKPFDRFAVFSDDKKLEWGGRLRKGDHMYVKLSGDNASTPTWSAGVVKYAGPVEGLPGKNFGVIITDSRYLNKGCSEGWFRNVRYFECDYNCGMFVSLDKLAAELPHQVPQDALPQSKSTKLPVDNDKVSDTPVDKTPHHKFKINDRVVVYNKKNEPAHGNIRWIGRIVQTRTLDSIHIGIETDNVVACHDFPKGLTGVSHLFYVTPGCRLVVPEFLVFREKLADTHNPPPLSADDLPTSQPSMLSPINPQVKHEQIHSHYSQSGQKEVLKEERSSKSSHPRSNQGGPQSHLNHGGFQSTLNQGGFQLSTDQGGHRDLSQCNTPGYPLQDNTGGTQQPHNMHRVPSHNQMAPQDYGKDDYVNSEAVDEYLRNSQYNQSNQPQPQWQSNAGYHHHYHNAGVTYQPPQQLAAQQQLTQHPVPKACPLLGNQMSPQVQPVASVRASNPYHLAVGSPVQVATTDPNEPPRYGVIKWIGSLTGVDGQVAGIELNKHMDGCSDGTFTPAGQKFFSCQYGRGLYFPLASLRPAVENPIRAPMEESTDQLVNNPSDLVTQYLGNGRGIQGHQNSCYLDSTVFGLFALSDVFDTMFLEPSDDSLSSDLNRKRVADLLWKGIVNPLRKYGVVRYESVKMMTNALDELCKMEGITEKERDPEEFLNILFKHVLHTKPFISIRRPFGVEQEFFVQLFVEHDPNLRLPTVGDLLHRMFREQQISFKRVPSKLLLQVPRSGREFQTYKRLVPELKISIGDLAYLNKNACSICGMNATTVCENCQSGLLKSTNYCQRCSDLFHKNTSHEERAKHKLSPVQNEDVFGDPDLLSVICIETSHYVCFTRDPRDDGDVRWIFFDSMADRQYDTYSIPRVTDCTRELNEWVYQGDRERLFNAQPRELPELVRRFTQDVYMCVYVQPDIAMYGDGDEIYEEEMQDITPFVSRKSKDDAINGREQEIGSLREEITILKQNLKKEQTQRLEQEHITTQQLANKDEQNEQLRQQTQQLEQKNQQLEHQKQQAENESRRQSQQRQQAENEARRQSQRYQQQITDLQQRLEATESKTSQSMFTKVQIPQQDEDSWNVRRQEVTLQNELGHGAWGAVYRGMFRGQPVAVKCAHRQILHETTIDQLKREIRIMAHVQHPNLVRLLAAVVDDQAQRKRDSPLLVLELLDTDLRSAYKEKIVSFDRNGLISIFRDVAYALHYLHEHQEPIIHRDVSAPNVLLQKIAPGVWKAKLSDFGSANLAKRCKTLAPGAIVYAAPETFPPSDPRSPLPKQTTKIDVFSYGYLLVEAVAKKMPSPDNRSTMLEDIERDWRQLYDIVIACIESKPDNRLTMTQVLEKLNMLS